MIIVIHGPAGTGKSTVSKILQQRLGANRTVVMDIDHCCDIDLHYEERQKMVEEIIGLYRRRRQELIFIVNWVFTDFNVLKRFVDQLLKIDQPVHVFIFKAQRETRSRNLLSRSDAEIVTAKSNATAADLEKGEWAFFKNVIDCTNFTQDGVAETIIHEIQ